MLVVGGWMSDVLRRGRHVPIHGQIAQEQLHLLHSREQVFPRTHPVKADVALRGLSPHQVTPMSGAHPLPPANSRRPFCFGGYRRLAATWLRRGFASRRPWLRKVVGAL